MRVDKAYPIYRPYTQRGGGGHEAWLGRQSYIQFVYPLPKSCCSDPIPEGTCCVFNNSDAFGVVEYKVAFEVFIIVFTLSPQPKILDPPLLPLIYREWAEVRWSENSLDLSAQTKLIKLLLLISDI